MNNANDSRRQSQLSIAIIWVIVVFNSDNCRKWVALKRQTFDSNIVSFYLFYVRFVDICCLTTREQTFYCIFRQNQSKKAIPECDWSQDLLSQRVIGHFGGHLCRIASIRCSPLWVALLSMTCRQNFHNISLQSYIQIRDNIQLMINDLIISPFIHCLSFETFVYLFWE